MNYFILPFILLLMCASAQATIYKVVNEDGSINYTDSPPEGAEKEVVDLPPIFTEPAVPLPSQSPIEEEALEDLAQPLVMSILSPLDETNIPTGQQTVPIEIRLSQPLRPDQLVQVLMDGQLRAGGSDTQFVLDNIERGEHTIEARVVGISGDVHATSSPVTIYVHRASALSPSAN